MSMSQRVFHLDADSFFLYFNLFEYLNLSSVGFTCDRTPVNICDENRCAHGRCNPISNTDYK